MKCFVIMPFGNPRDDPDRARKLELIYSQWLKPTVENIKIPNNLDERIECHRADKELAPGEIISHIIENLVVSDIVIADLSGRNPNVFYELGVRHAVNNNTILIAEDVNDIPFDLRGLRAITYQYEPEQMINLKTSLEQAIYRILAEPKRIDNPIRRFLYEREVDRLVRKPVPPGYDAVKSVLDEMIQLRQEFRDYAGEVRRVMNLVTRSEKEQQLGFKGRAITVDFFEGIWTSDEGGTFCARVVDGKLYIPYCYDGNSELSAHEYNCRVIGDALFARFDWFRSSISGYNYYRVESEDQMTGGWWTSEYFPEGLLGDISQVNETIPGMHRVTLKRDHTMKEFPYWAEEYFDKHIYLMPLRLYNG